MDAERNYILSLLKRPDEGYETALDRFWSVGYVDLMEISTPQRRDLLALIQDNASKDRATSVQLAAQIAGLDKNMLEKMVCAVDPDGVDVYARLMLDSKNRGRLRSITKDIEGSELSPGELADKIQRELAEVRAADEEERITRLPQAGRNFIAWLKEQQELKQRGVPRIGFHWETLNDMVAYLFPGNMILLTAKTKVGKSSFAQEWFDSQLMRGFKGLYFHFEDPPEVMGLKRTARLIGMHSKSGDIISFKKMLMGILTEGQMVEIERVNDLAVEWAVNGTQIWCADWTMQQVIRVWRREHFNGNADFVIVDYLNKAHLSPHDQRYLGVFESRARDAEMVKSTAEATRSIAMLIQQEGDDGSPFQTRQGAQKSQVHISLRRERLGEDEGRKLSKEGAVCIMNANLGETGDIEAEFIPDFMMWDEKWRVIG